MIASAKPLIVDPSRTETGPRPTGTEAIVLREVEVTGPDGAALLAPTTLAVDHGQILMLTGPSGAGKTTLMRALVGDLPDSAVLSGTVEIYGVRPFDLSPTALRRFRSRRVAFVAQDAQAALNPTMTVDSIVHELASSPGRVPDVLAKLSLDPVLLRRRPAQLSGGQARRVAIARALVRDPAVLVLDEPLAGLDKERQAELLAVLRSIADSGTTIVLSGHRRTAPNQIPDVVCQIGPPTQAPAPLQPQRPRPRSTPPVLRAEGLSVVIGSSTLLHDATLDLPAGTLTALLGPSGAGKTTVALALAGIQAGAQGRITVRGSDIDVRLRKRPQVHLGRIQLVPQDPLSTLNPTRTIGQTLERPLTLHRGLRGKARTAAVLEFLTEVGLDGTCIHRYPSELSGGQRQRVAIARALAADPDVLLCDEVTSALDPANARRILRLLSETAMRHDCAVLFITHDLDLAGRFCHRAYRVRDGVLTVQGGC